MTILFKSYVFLKTSQKSLLKRKEETITFETGNISEPLAIKLQADAQVSLLQPKKTDSKYEAVRPIPIQEKAKIDKTKLKKNEQEEWFTMKQTPMTEAVKRDLHILKNRAVLDPKRHYKRQDGKLPKVFQLGEIISAPDDFFTGRLTKREKQVTIVDELLNDQKSRVYMKRRVQEVQEKRSNTTRKGWKGRKTIK